jgi:hypothetical protein
MHPTVLLVLANDRIADLAADSARIRLAERVQEAPTAATASSGGSVATSLRAIARLVRGAVRPVPPATAG